MKLTCSCCLMRAMHSSALCLAFSVLENPLKVSTKATRPGIFSSCTRLSRGCGGAVAVYLA